MFSFREFGGLSVLERERGREREEERKRRKEGSSVAECMHARELMCFQSQESAQKFIVTAFAKGLARVSGSHMGAHWDYRWEMTLRDGLRRQLHHEMHHSRWKLVGLLPSVHL